MEGSIVCFSACPLHERVQDRGTHVLHSIAMGSSSHILGPEHPGTSMRVLPKSLEQSRTRCWEGASQPEPGAGA